MSQLIGIVPPAIKINQLFIEGGDFYYLNIKADSMAEAGVNCQDCHPLEKGQIKRLAGSELS